jgi:hypothetical protein
MNIYNYLKKEHKKVSQMLDQVLITKDEDERLELYHFNFLIDHLYYL